MKCGSLLTMILNKPSILWSKQDASSHFDFKKSIRSIITKKWVETCLKSGFYRDNLIYVACLTKSASCILDVVFDRLLREKAPFKKFWKHAFPRHMEADWQLRPESLLDFPFGGILAYHFNPTWSNIGIINDSKYIILVRHPADHLAAFFNDKLGMYNKNSRLVNGHIGTLPSKIFDPKGDMEESFDYMIKGGYLSATIDWINNWLLFRNPDRSLVICFEDLVTDLHGCLNNISNFLVGCNTDKSFFEYVKKIADEHAKKSQQNAPSGKYKKGYTGKIGIWRDYFTKRNKENYLKVIEAKFSSSGSYGIPIREFYKDCWPLPQ